MTIAIAVIVAVVAVLGIILAAHKIRPRSLRFTASVTRWLSMSLEIESPAADADTEVTKADGSRSSRRSRPR